MRSFDIKLRVTLSKHCKVKFLLFVSYYFQIRYHTQIYLVCQYCCLHCNYWKIAPRFSSVYQCLRPSAKLLNWMSMWSWF